MLFRPHFIAKLSAQAGSYDANGDYIVGNEIIGKKVSCRFEINNKAQTIQLKDGTTFCYNFVVYLDKDTEEFVYGDKCILYDNKGVEIDTLIVKGFQRGQLHNRLWA